MRMLFAVVATLLSGAPAAPVVSFYPDTNFDHYRSYTWVFKSMPAGIDANLYRQITVSVDHSLNSHGFVRAEPGDFAVAFTIGPRSNVHPSDYGHYSPYYSGSEADAHHDWVNRELATRSSHEHTLAIDIYDTYTKHAVWHGLAPVEILPQTRQAIVEHEVDQVLSQFPPSAQHSK
jgi:hypothetical protein